MGCCGGTSNVPVPRRFRPGGVAIKQQGIRVTVYSEAEVQAQIKAHPGMSVVRADFGPTTIVLTFTPKG